MNSLLDKILGQNLMVSNESATMSELDEMNQEIAMEAEIDEAFADMDASGIFATAEGTEYFFAGLAERELSLESMAGADAVAVYHSFGLESFGMEAAKDVLARKAYAGVAAIKALIATIINWFKNLLGFYATSKKVFAAIEKKTAKEGKELKKIATKIPSGETLKKDIRDYSGAVSDLFVDFSTFEKEVKGNIDTTVTKEAFQEKLTTIKKTYDPAKETLVGRALYEAIVKHLTTINEKAAENKGKDIGKDIKAKIKSLEEAKKNLGKKVGAESTATTMTGEISMEKQNRNNEINSPAMKKLAEAMNGQIGAINKLVEGLAEGSDPEETKASLNAKISRLRDINTAVKAIIKEIVKATDDCLVMSKAIRASI